MKWLLLCVELSGERGAPPLALLNGAYSNLHSWAPVMPYRDFVAQLEAES